APDLDVVLGLDQGRPALRVFLERGHRVEPALPVWGGEHVLDHLPHRVQRCVDLLAGAAAQMCHRSLSFPCRLRYPRPYTASAPPGVRLRWSIVRRGYVQER